MSLEAPADLTKSIFAGNMRNISQLKAFESHIQDEGIQASVAFSKAPGDDTPGFFMVTPKTAEDYKKLLQMRMMEHADSNIYFSPKKSY